MPNPVLIALVGDDPLRAEELVAIVAGLVASHLRAMHGKEEFEGSINDESSERAPRKDSSSLHQAVNYGPGTLQPGKYREAVWAKR